MYRIIFQMVCCLLLLTLSACSNGHSSVEDQAAEKAPKRGRIQQLTSNGNPGAANGQITTEEGNEIKEEMPAQPGYGIPQEDPEHQLKFQEPNDQNQPITKLPFQDFKERWNAISNEQGSNLIISSFEKKAPYGNTYYSASFQNQLELRLFVINDKVESIQMIGAGGTNAAILSMLTGGSQIYYLLNPTDDSYSVNTLFSELGVEPNAQLDHVEEKSFVHRGIQYRIMKTDKGYTFEASYLKK